MMRGSVSPKGLALQELCSSKAEMSWMELKSTWERIQKNGQGERGQERPKPKTGAM